MSLPGELEALVAPLLDGHARLRRRRRRRKQMAVAAIFAGAAVLATAALAAHSSWIFFRTGHFGTEARTEVVFHGRTYVVNATVSPDGRMSGILLFASRNLSRPLASGGGTSILPALGVSPLPLLPPPTPTGHTAFGNSYTTSGGEIWFGDARPDVTRVVLTDSRGKQFSTATVKPPGSPSAFRFWAVALPASHAAWIASYDRRGRIVERRRLYATPQMGLS
ncbi:MAG TPA: hypothetical protein VHC01_07480 [Gaiellaceae bacterium]|nr:hypothetical protein [Gaiellaceae bacterium]